MTQSDGGPEDANDAELRARVARTNPVLASTSGDAAGSGHAQRLREQIMMETTDQDLDQRDTARWTRPGVLLAGAAAVAVLAVGGAVLAFGGADDGSAPSAATPAIVFDLPEADPMRMCLPISEIVPPPGAVALGGTVDSIDGDLVVIAVDHWFAGSAGAVETVGLRGASQSVALDGVEFTVGEDVLVTAADGAVAVCGMSGPATDDLRAHYDAWYSG